MRALCAVVFLCAASGLAGSAHADAAGEGAGATGADTVEIDTCAPPSGLSPREAENRAAAHYDRGTRLYEQGDYDAAIEEFVSAYCLKPFYRVLKDIAQSFERRVDYEQAVAYLDRYLAELPAEAVEERRVQSGRVEVLRRLPARLRVATVPRGAEVVLRDESGIQARARADDPEPIAIPRGRYTMVVTLAGYEPLRREVEVEIGQPYSFYFQLEPTRGSLRLVTVPATARIFVDKRWVAVGNHADDLPVGRHMVEVEAEGYQTRREEVTITAAGAHNLTLELEPVPRSGRAELIVAAAAGGGLWGGVASSTVFGRNNLLGAAGAGLGLGLGLGGTYLGVPKDIEVGSSSYIIGASLAGATEGSLIASLAVRQTSLCQDERDPGDTIGGVRVNDSCVARVVLGAGLAAGVAGAVVATLTEDRLSLDAGDASMINSGALWGAVAAGLLWGVVDRDARVGELLGLTGLNLGALSGVLLAQNSDYSRRHVALIDLGGLGGLLMGVALANALSDNGNAGANSSPAGLAGMTVGLVATAYLTRNMDEISALPMLAPTVGSATDAGGRTAMTIGLGAPF
ncbi:PEGA domain-containing protein [Haliangium sp.]|uniref:PEGA domain-containing protein n=1 Tax=Haliangium sp. TaxID=2663208 RepID=UPI003D14CF6F